MSLNSWNLSQTKTHFMIRQRKQAQKKHLQKLKNTKSSFEIPKYFQTSQTFHPGGSRSRVAGPQCQQKLSIENQHRAAEDTMISSIVRKVKYPSGGSVYVENLRASSSLYRLRETMKIQKQNERLYSRLIKAKPSISGLQLKKNHFIHQKYKENILKNKYLNPDYTKQVKAHSKSFTHQLLKPINNLAKIKDGKPLGCGTKQNLKSENYRQSNLKSHRLTDKSLQN